MQKLSLDEWGKVYAYMWKAYQEGNPTWRSKFEKDTGKCVAQIIDKLNKNHGANIGSGLCLHDIPLPGELTEAELDEIAKGWNKDTRFICSNVQLGDLALQL